MAPWILVYDAGTFKSTVSVILRNGLLELRNFKDGADWVRKAKVMRQFYLVMEIRGWERHLLGNKDYVPEREVNPYQQALMV